MNLSQDMTSDGLLPLNKDGDKDGGNKEIPKMTDYLRGGIKMKIIIGTSLLFLGLLAPLCVYAANSGNITISGNVPATTSIQVNPTAGYNALDLTASPVDQQVATVREANNTQNGYTVTLSSANAGILKNGNLGSLNYTAKYNGSAATLSVNPVTVTNAGPSNTPVIANKPFTISYTGLPAEQMMVGTYSDTLTFVIKAN